MKYAIRGVLNVADESIVVGKINQYTLWRLITNTGEAFTFEAWVNTVTDKDSLFTELKTLISTGSQIDWHACTHDESNHTPCVIAETYVRG